MILKLDWEIIYVIVNLLVLFLLMKKFLFGPVTRLLDERAQRVADTLDKADLRLTEAEQSKTEYDRRLAEARLEADRILEEAHGRAELAYSRRLAEAQEDIRKLNEQAERQREADRAAMLAEAKKQIAALVLLTTAKVSQRAMTAETDRALLDSMLEEAEGEI